MIYFVDIDGQKFTCNGVPYFKNFTPHVVGDKVRVVNTYDTRFELCPFTDFAEFSVNGEVFASAALLQAALLPVLYTRTSLGDGEGGIDQDNIPKEKNLFYSGEPTTETLATLVNNLPAFTIGEKQLYIFAATNLVDDGQTPSTIKFVIKNSGKGPYGFGGTTLTASDIFILVNTTATLNDVLANPLVQQINLGEIGSSPVQTEFNLMDPAVVVQSQSTAPIVVNTLFLGSPVSYLFLGAGGTYGVGELQSTVSMFTVLGSVPSSNGVDFLVYTALLTQTGTSAPVATVLKNTLGTITWTYEAVGEYYANSSGLFVNNKTAVLLGIGRQSPSNTIGQTIGSTDIIQITSGTLSGVATNGLLSGTFIEIRVYP
jgi:hypothetical protein